MSANSEGRREVVKATFDSICESLKANKDSVARIVSSFQVDTPQLVMAFSKAIKDGNELAATKSIHKLKNHLGYFGLEDTMHELHILEEGLQSKVASLRDAGDLRDRVSDDVDIILDVLSTHKCHPMEEDATQSAHRSQKTVLLAEDDEINAMVFQMFIRELGAAVLIARNGYEAINLSLSSNPDLIITDIHMPFFDGIETIAELRSKGVQCPIVALSASSRSDQKENAMAAGADDFILKPINRTMVHDIVGKYLR